MAIDTANGVVERLEFTPRRHSQRLLGLLEEAMQEAGIGAGQVDGVAFGRGPGGFVGVRLAASVAQGLCTAWGVPALPVSTLEALASGARRKYAAQRVIAALDARMGQVYWGEYGSTDIQSAGSQKAGGRKADGDCPGGSVQSFDEPWQLADEPLLMAARRTDAVADPEELASCIVGDDWFAIGQGFAAYASRLPQPMSGSAPDALPQARDLLPRARCLFAGGYGVGAQQALPIYLREGV